MILAERLQLALDRCGLSPYQLSTKAGASGSYVANAITRNAQRGDTEKLRAIARVAGVSERWLILGEGTPDSDDDARAPSTSESSVPEMGNAIGWDDAEAAARAQSSYPEEVWTIVRQIAPFAVRGIVTEDDALELARLVARLSDPLRMGKQLAEAYQRQKELRARLDAKGRG